MTEREQEREGRELDDYGCIAYSQTERKVSPAITAIHNGRSFAAASFTPSLASVSVEGIARAFRTA